MRLTDFVSREAIKVPLVGRTKEAVIRELIEILPLSREEALNPRLREEIFISAMDRERILSTGIGDGIAIPHATAHIMEDHAVALGIARPPIDFQAIDRKPVSLVFFVVANEEHTRAVVKILARITRLLHLSESFRKRLGESRSPEEALEIIRAEEARHLI
jgi:mannitol/fructose-specific phosphotransferase system IIA component (Ntr-type)